MVSVTVYLDGEEIEQATNKLSDPFEVLRFRGFAVMTMTKDPAEQARLWQGLADAASKAAAAATARIETLA